MNEKIELVDSVRVSITLRNGSQHNMRYYFKHINRLSRGEAARLNKLAFKNNALQNRLRHREYDVLSVVCIAKNTNNTIVGWLSAGVYYSHTCCNINLGVFTDSHYRRHGVGSELVRRFEMMLHVLIEGKKKSVCVSVHDDASRGFWTSLGYKVQTPAGISWYKRFED